MTRALLLAGIAPLFFHALPAAAKPKPMTVVVGSCMPGLVTFPNIGAALTAVPAGSIIDVCPGIYAEQLTISQSVTLQGVSDTNSSAPTIVPPASGLVQNANSLSQGGTPYAAQVAAINAGTVKIANVTVDGTNNQIAGCGPILTGILFQNTAGTIQGNQVVNQALVPTGSLGGCQSGNAIEAQSSGNTAYGVVISGNQVENFQKNGITTDGPALTGTISGNTVNEIGPSPNIAQNGIQVGPGGTATVSGNVVSDVVYTGPSYGATGILVYDALSVIVSTNTVSDTQGGVYVFADTAGLSDNPKISKNIVTATHTYDGVDVCAVNGANIVNNTITGSDESAIHIDGECVVPSSTVTVSGNKVNGACAAVLEGPGVSASAPSNNVFLNADLLISTGTDFCSGVTPQLPANAHQGARPARRPSPKL